MRKKSVSLAISLPRGRRWQPSDGVFANKSYCSLCSESRRAIAAEALGLRPLNDVSAPYFLPRALRANGS